MDANSEIEDFLLEGEGQEKPVFRGSRYKCPRALILSYSLLFISITSNIFQIFSQTKSFSSCISESSLSHSKFANLHNNALQIPLDQSSPYNNPNDTLRDHLWDTISYDIGFVAVDKKWAASKGLPYSASWPWNESRSLYWIDSYHQLHCVKLLYQAFMDQRTHHTPRIEQNHIVHCLDKLYAEIRCNAKDELIAAPGPTPPPGTDLRQSRSCRNWDALEEWAQAHTSCFRYGDTAAVTDGRNHIDRMQYCPEGTPELEKVKKYFGKGEDWRAEDVPKYSWFDN